jgi:LPS-assembly lipoprotein
MSSALAAPVFARRALAATLGLALASLLGACGFALQGTTALPPEMQNMWLDSPDSRSAFAVELRRTLAAREQPLASRPDEATAVLRVLEDQAGERVLSVSATGVPEELELFHTVRFQLRADNRMLLPSEVITVTRDFRFDPDDILGKRREAEELQQAILRDVVSLVLRRLDLLARESA